jgi:hemoglobin
MNAIQSIYSRMGGEPVLRKFVDHLYDFMDYFPAVEPLRKMHSADLTQARERLFMFLSGMLGGPPLYMQAYGHPRLRQKHMHFKIGDYERDQWLLCAHNAANQLDISNETREDMMAQITMMADHLRNQDGNASHNRGSSAYSC